MVNNKQRFNLIVKKIAVAMQKKKLPKNLREMFLLSLQQSLDIINVIAGKIKLTKDFHDLHIKIHNLDAQKLKKDREQYNFFLKLKKYGLIHYRSSYFARLLSLISINPNPAFVYKVNLADVDNFLDAKESLFTIEHTASFEEKKQLIYNDLRLFQNMPLSPQEISKISTDDIIFLDDVTALLYLEHINIMKTSIPSYYLIKISGHHIIGFLNICKSSGNINPFTDKQLEKNFKIFRNTHFDKVHISYLKMLNQNAILHDTSPVHTVINTTRNTLSPLNISEIDHMYPGTVPKHLMAAEEERIKQSLKRPINDEEEEDEEVLELPLFTLKDFEKLEILRKIPFTEKTKFTKHIDPVKLELESYLESSDCTQHSEMIIEYVLYLLSRIDIKHEIRISTFKGYLGLLDKHLFHKILNLNDIQSHEINQILDNLLRLQYKQKSIRKIRSLIIAFFRFHSKKHKIDFLSAASYPKSLVFDDEIDDILEAIVKEEEKLAQNAAEKRAEEKEEKKGRKDEKQKVVHRVGDRVKHAILQKQTLVLLAYYFGLRKSELRGRLKSDLSSGKGKLCINVNKEGMKKCKLELKTSSAQRHVCSQISNKKHLKILKEFWKLRLKIKNKSPFLFLKINKNYEIKSKPIGETVFDQISYIIQDITKRYTSFHSLRHSYVSYQCLQILQDKDSDIYDIINLSTKTGHRTPEPTMKVYTHASIILLNTGEITQ